MLIKAAILPGGTIEDVVRVAAICAAIERMTPLTLDPYRSYRSISFERDTYGRAAFAEVQFEGRTYVVDSGTTLANLRTVR